MNIEVFKRTFSVYYGKKMSEIYQPKLTDADRSRIIIYHLQLAADAADLVLKSIDIQDEKIVVNKTIYIEYSIFQQQ